MTTPEIDLTELAAMAKPLREQLGVARHEVVRLLHESNTLPTRQERADARQRLALARTRRDLYKRLLFRVQDVLESPRPEARLTVLDFLAMRTELRTVVPGVES